MSIDWRTEVSDGLTPQEVCAGLSTGSILTTDLPEIATWWLADGRDTPALRELGGARMDDAWALDDLWSRVCDDVGVSKPDDEQAARVDVRRILETSRSDRRSTRDVLRELDRMALYRFHGLDVTVGPLDDIEGRWGRKESEVLAIAEQRLGDLVRALGPRPAWPTTA